MDRHLVFEFEVGNDDSPVNYWEQAVFSDGEAKFERILPDDVDADSVDAFTTEDTGWPVKNEETHRQFLPESPDEELKYLAEKIAEGFTVVYFDTEPHDLVTWYEEYKKPE